jgi:hypothetical protein
MLGYCLSKKIQETQKRVSRRRSFLDSASDNGNDGVCPVFLEWNNIEKSFERLSVELNGE